VIVLYCISGHSQPQSPKAEDRMFLSPKDRCQELNNEPGTTWYRMPVIGICQGIAEGSIPALENECGFYDPTPTEEYDQCTICLLPVRLLPVYDSS
jgi:hypothetical protein